MSPIRFVCATAMLALALGSGTAAIAKGPDFCPPGLAKKSPACVPPGQAKKMRAPERDRDRYDDARDRGEWRLEQERLRLERERALLRNERLRLEDERRRAEWERLYGDRTAVWSSPRPRARAPLPYGWPLPEGEQWVRIGDSAVRLDAQGRPIIRLPSIPDLLDDLGN